MTDLDLCAAQYCAIAGDLHANLQRHLQVMRLAAEQRIDFLLFPELSLTGYEPSLARELAQATDTALLQPLRTLAKQLRMTTVVGLPLRTAESDAVLIGSVLCGADGSQAIYTKQHLHAGEERVFSPGTGGAASSCRVSNRAMPLSAMAPLGAGRSRKVNVVDRLEAAQMSVRRRESSSSSLPIS